jgi:hypothetical protein
MIGLEMIDRTILPSQMPKPPPRPKKVPRELEAKVGYAWVFEKAVVYGPGSLRESWRSVKLLMGRKSKKRIESKFGRFIGPVKGLLPVDPYFITYEFLKSTPGYKKRKWMRKRKGIREEARALKKEKRDAFKWDPRKKKRTQLTSFSKQLDLERLMK